MDYVATIRDQAMGMWQGFIALLPNLAIALVILFVTAIIARFATSIADKITGKSSMREDLRQLIETVVRLLIWLGGIMLALIVAIAAIFAFARSREAKTQ